MNPEIEGYHEIKAVDLAIQRLPDNVAQSFLLDVDLQELEVAMKGFEEVTKKKIIKNVSEDLAGVIADDMMHLGPVRIKDVKYACLNIYKELVKLYD